MVPDEDGVWRMPDARLARRHRSNIGTIVSDASMQVQFVSGGKLGSVEESFIARLKPGDVFMFAGRLLELVRTQQMTAYVRTAPKGQCRAAALERRAHAAVNTLADAMLRQLEQAERGVFASPEMRCAQPCWRCRTRGRPCPHPAAWWPRCCTRARAGTCTCTRWRGGWCTWGWRARWRGARRSQVPNTFSIAVNDYGLSRCQPNRWTGLRCCRT